jgi:hypothetical protein
VLLVLKAAAIRTKAGEPWCTTTELPVLDAWVKSKLCYFHPGMELAEWVVRLLSSQDDVLVSIFSTMFHLLVPPFKGLRHLLSSSLMRILFLLN